ncbi:MAG: hypothetical protein R6X11_01925 [Desulfonatronovibrio sp.]
MELVFICPVRNRDFSTTSWTVSESLVPVSDSHGKKKLLGSVKAYCPYCSEDHAFSPDEIPCPLSNGMSG